MADDPVSALNPDPTKQPTSIRRSMYEPVRAAILAALSDDELLFGDLPAEVERRTDPDLWTDASVGWYTTTVKLDLEARGLIERFGSPQRLRRTPTDD